MTNLFTLILCGIFVFAFESNADGTFPDPKNSPTPPEDTLGFPSRDPNLDALPGFQNPPPGYGEVPFWWWTGDPLDKERLPWQIEQRHEKGISGMQVNYAHEDSPGWPTYAAEPGVFSDAWWDVWKYVAGECGKRGMGIGLSGYTLDWPGGRSLISSTIDGDPEIQGPETAIAHEQRGSLAAHFAMTSAWGGACVDNDWGGKEGDFLRYHLELPTEFPALHVTLRYARQTAGKSVMSVTALDAIRPDDPAALETLRFLQQNRHGGLHLNLGYSRGVWPYLSAEVALWHLQLGDTDEAWRILRAMVDRASSTVSWYEEIDHQPPRGHGDRADVWAAAEMVYLTRRLQLAEQGKDTNNP